MAGEFKLASKIIDEAEEAARQNPPMDVDAMHRAMLNELLLRLAKRQPRPQLSDLIQFHLDAIDESEFVITRGC